MENFLKKPYFNSKELLKKIKKIPWILGKHAFLCILILVLIDILIGGLLLYVYGISTDKKEPTDVSSPNQFKETIYQLVLEQWKERDSALENFLLSDENYTDPFK